MKKFFLGLVFNSRQRQIIWNAILFSAHTYLRRGNTAKAAEVQQVINETEGIFGAKTTYTKAEVDSLLQQAAKEVQDTAKKAIEKAESIAFHAGFDAAVKAVADGEIEIKTATIEVKPKTDAEAHAEETGEEGTQEGQNDGEQEQEGTEAGGTATNEHNEE